MPPKRKATAPKPTKVPSPDVDSDFLDDDQAFQKIFMPELDSNSESDYSEYGSRRRPNRKKTKITQFKSGRTPKVPGLSDDEWISHPREGSPVFGVDTMDWTTKESTNLRKRSSRDGRSRQRNLATPNILQIHVNATSKGPAVINLSLAEVLGSSNGISPLTSPQNLQAGFQTNDGIDDDGTTLIDPPASKRSRKGRKSSRLPKSRIINSSSAIGFLNLPLEIRLRIYRKIFVTETPIDFASREELCRSSAFLRTCRTVYEEGRSVLYGENAFHFERTPRTRGQYWEKEWKEIGFKDVRRFLETIGNSNISHMKYVSFLLFDAAPGVTPYLDEAERRFANDPVLHRCFALIASNTILSKLALTFSGRRPLTSDDYHFLKQLTSMKCLEFVHASSMDYHYSKVRSELIPKMKKVMEVSRTDYSGSLVDKRKPTVKMYHEKPRPSHYYAW